MSLPLDEIISILRDGGHITDAKALQAVARDLTKVENEIKAAKEPVTKSRSRLAILVRGDSALQAALAGGAWVVSVPDDDTSNTYMGAGLVDRLRKAVAAHNEAPRKRRSKGKARIETWFQAMTTLKAKTIKESGSQIGIKAKGTPSEVVVLTSETVVP